MPKFITSIILTLSIVCVSYIPIASAAYGPGFVIPNSLQQITPFEPYIVEENIFEITPTFIPRPSTTYTGEDYRQELSEIISLSFMSPSYTANTNLKTTLGNSRINVDGIIKKHNTTISSDMSVDMKLNTNDLPKEMHAGEDFFKNNIEIYLSFDKSVQQNISAETLSFSINNFQANVLSTDQELVNIIKGFLEIGKIFTDKSYYFNFKDLKNILSDQMSENKFNEFSSFLSQKLSLETINEFYKNLIASGIFNISKDGNIYTLTLTNNPSSIDTEKLYNGLIQILPAQINVSEIVESMQFMIPMINNFARVSFTITTENQKISESDLNITLNQTILTSIGIPNFQIQSKNTFDYSPVTITPITKAKQVNITKIIEAVNLSTKRAMRQFNSQTMEY